MDECARPVFTEQSNKESNGSVPQECLPSMEWGTRKLLKRMCLLIWKSVYDALLSKNNLLKNYECTPRQYPRWDPGPEKEDLGRKTGNPNKICSE